MSAESLEFFAPSALVPSETNPSTRTADLDELVESVRAQGIIEPVIARRIGKKVEIVCGHRRVLAAKGAKLEAVPTIVRELTDSEALELQLVENLDRLALHPVDEARHFQRLLDAGETAAAVAARVGRSSQYVHQRVALLNLTPKALRALDAGDLTVSVALMIARIPDAKLQEEALSYVGGSSLERCMEAKEASKELQGTVMCKLSRPGFDTAADDLVPDAGACTDCTKRTASQRALFAEVDDDLCIDPKCFRQKLDAAFKLRAKQAKSEGTEVLSASKAKTAFGYGSGYVREDGHVYNAGKSVKVSGLIKSSGLTTVLAQDPRSGRAVRLVREDDAKKVVRDTGKKPETGAKKQNPEEEQQKIRRAAVMRLADCAAQFDSANRLEEAVPLLARAVLATCWEAVQRKVLVSRGIERGNKQPTEEALLQWCRTRQAAEQLAAALEAIAYRFGESEWGPTKQLRQDLEQLLGLTITDAERLVKQEGKPKAARREKKKTSRAKPKKRV